MTFFSVRVCLQSLFNCGRGWNLIVPLNVLSGENIRTDRSIVYTYLWGLPPVFWRWTREARGVGVTVFGDRRSSSKTRVFASFLLRFCFVSLVTRISSHSQCPTPLCLKAHSLVGKWQCTKNRISHLSCNGKKVTRSLAPLRSTAFVPLRSIVRKCQCTESLLLARRFVCL